MTPRSLLLPCLLLLSLVVRAEEATPTQLRGFPETSLTITHAGGRDSFRVWLADTSQRQMQGLMFVRDMPADRGMLFPQREPRSMSMWMKNTYMSLDILFIDPQGVITGIAADTRPLSLATIDSPGEVGAVLELRAGEARRRGIATGDRVAVQPVLR